MIGTDLLGIFLEHPPLHWSVVEVAKGRELLPGFHDIETGIK
jgi:hypothetical protein